MNKYSAAINNVRKSYSGLRGKVTPDGIYIFSIDNPFPILIENEERWHGALIGHTFWGIFQSILYHNSKIESEYRVYIESAYFKSVDLTRTAHEAIAKYLAYIDTSKDVKNNSDEWKFLKNELSREKSENPLLHRLDKQFGSPLKFHQGKRDLLYTLGKLCLNVDIMHRLVAVLTPEEFLETITAMDFLIEYDFDTAFGLILDVFSETGIDWKHLISGPETKTSLSLRNLEKLVYEEIGDELSNTRLVTFFDYSCFTEIDSLTIYEISNPESSSRIVKSFSELLAQCATNFEFCTTGNMIASYLGPLIKTFGAYYNPNLYKLNKKDHTIPVTPDLSRFPKSLARFDERIFWRLIDPAYTTIIAPLFPMYDWDPASLEGFYSFLNDDPREKILLSSPYVCNEYNPGLVTFLYLPDTNEFIISPFVINNDREYEQFFITVNKENVIGGLFIPDFCVRDTYWLPPKWPTIILSTETTLGSRTENAIRPIAFPKESQVDGLLITSELMGLFEYNKKENLVKLSRTPKYFFELIDKRDDIELEWNLETFVDDNRHIFLLTLLAFRTAFGQEVLPPSFYDEETYG